MEVSLERVKCPVKVKLTFAGQRTPALLIVSTYDNTEYTLKVCPVWMMVNNEALHAHCGSTHYSADIINMCLY